MTELLDQPQGEIDDEETLEGSRMTLGEHLDELRTRFIRSAIAIFVSFALCWAFHTQIGAIAMAPGKLAIDWTNQYLAERAEEKLAADETLLRTDFFQSDDAENPLYLRLEKPIPYFRGFSAGSGFLFYLRVCLYAGIVLSGAFVLWQMWLFVAAGLYAKEKRVVFRSFPISVGLFFGGILFGYFVMVPYAQYFLLRMSIDDIGYEPRIEDYWLFLKNLCVALGIVFQLPIVMMVLARIGLVDPKVYGRYRGQFILVALVISALLTPPDPVTQMMMAAPMLVLYELGIVFAKLAYKKAQEVAA